MDGLSRGMEEVLSQLAHPSQIASQSDSEFKPCEKCGEPIKRMYIPFLKKHIYPKCKCEITEFEKQQEEQERFHRKKSIEKAYRHNIMNENLKSATFESFQIRQGTETIYRACKAFVENFEDRKTGLLGYGNPGNGKSHLFAAIHHELDRRGYVSLFIDCSQLLNIAAESKKSMSRISIHDIIAAAIGCDLLTLDEIGAGKLTQDEFTDVIFPIINGRQGKLTNYTTNLNLDELSTWLATDKYKQPLDDKGRIIDRILGSCDIVKNGATSKRQEDAMNRIRLIKEDAS